MFDSSVVTALDYMSAGESVARAISGNPSLDVRWMDQGVPHAKADGQIALVRPKALTETHKWVFLSDLIHECGHIAYTKWRAIDRFQKHGDTSLRWEFFHAIWNGYEDVFIEHFSIAQNTGFAYALRKGSERARELGCVKRPDGKVADLLPVTIIFHDFAQLRGWEEWSDDWETAWANLSAEINDPSKMAKFEELLSLGVPASTGDAISLARQTYDLFKDWIEEQEDSPSEGEVVQFDSAAQADADDTSESDESVSEADQSESDEQDEGKDPQEDEDSDESEGSQEGDEAESASEPDGAPEDDKPSFTEVLSGGSFGGMYYPEVRRLRLTRNPLAERCRSALERFDTPRKHRRTSNNGRLRPALAWQTRTGNARVFQRNRHQVDQDLPALGLMGDISGSMKRHLEAMLQGFSGILSAYERSRLPIGAWAFGAENGQLVELKNFADPVELGQARIASTEELAGGDTPLGHSVEHALESLSNVRHPQRKLVVLSDGLVDKVDQTLVRRAQDWFGIQVVLISIGSLCPAMEGVQTYSIESVHQLPEILREL